MRLQHTHCIFTDTQSQVISTLHWPCRQQQLRAIADEILAHARYTEKIQMSDDSVVHARFNLG